MSHYVTRPNTILAKFEDGTATREDVLHALNVRATMKQAVKEVDAAFEAAVIGWIEQHGEITDGTTRYYLGAKKTTKCRDQAELLRTLLETTGPDGVAKVLASGAFKHGACKEVLGDDWGKHFEVVTEPELAEGKPARKLQSVDQRFLR